MLEIVKRVQFEELRGMLLDEEFLKDFILDLDEVQRFEGECTSIADQTYQIAQDEVKKFEELSKTMELH